MVRSVYFLQASFNGKSNCFSGYYCEGYHLNLQDGTCKNFIMRTVPDQFSSWGPLNDPRCEYGPGRLNYVYNGKQGPVQTRYYIS